MRGSEHHYFFRNHRQCKAVRPPELHIFAIILLAPILVCLNSSPRAITHQSGTLTDRFLDRRGYILLDSVGRAFSRGPNDDCIESEDGMCQISN